MLLQVSSVDSGQWTVNTEAWVLGAVNPRGGVGVDTGQFVRLSQKHSRGKIGSCLCACVIRLLGVVSTLC